MNLARTVLCFELLVAFLLSGGVRSDGELERDEVLRFANPLLNRLRESINLETEEIDEMYFSEPSRFADWPWLAALLLKATQEYFCGGSLVSQHFVLTAAHCLQNKGESNSKNPNDVIVYLGKWNLTDNTEKDAVEVNPLEFYIHPEWQPVWKTRWDADIALIKLANDIAFNDKIQPIGLWTLTGIGQDEDDSGTAIGWGATENHSNGQHSDIPREAKLNIHPIIDCYETEEVRDLISRRGLCVGGKGAGPCSGDSGGGLYSFKHGQYSVRGITSASLTEAGGMSCDVYHQAVYTNVEKFTNWLEKIFDGSENMHCEFSSFGSPTGYICDLKTLPILPENSEIVGMKGQHQEDRSNSDVKFVKISAQKNAKHLPIKLGDYFPNLKSYVVINCGIEKISRQNFQDLKALEILRITKSLLKEVHEDTFADLSELTDLLLSHNQIEKIHSNTFIFNRKLKRIDLERNRIKVLRSGLFRYNSELKEIYLHRNLIFFIKPEILSQLKALEVFDIRDNTCIDALHGDPVFVRNSVSIEELEEMFGSQCQ